MPTRLLGFANERNISGLAGFSNFKTDQRISSTSPRCPLLVSEYHWMIFSINQWIGLGENPEETIDFSDKYGAFRSKILP